jgi:hypothetical protein
VTREDRSKCPHCGKEFLGSFTSGGLVPYHDFPVPCRAVCPGSGQHPRSMSDKRPLWKDEKKEASKP